MKAVALVGPVPPWRSGIADQTVRLARAMKKLGVAPVVFTYRRMYPRFLYPGISDFFEKRLGGFPDDIDARAILDGLNPLSFFFSSKEIAATGASLVLIPWWTAYWAPHILLLFAGLSRASPAVTKVLLCHNVYDHEGGPLKKALTRSVLRRADRLAAQNRREQALLASEFRDKPVALVPHPSEPRAVLPERETARARLGLPPDAPVFLFSGILRPYKGWELLLEAFARVRREFPLALLVFAGEPWGEAERLPGSDMPRGVRLELRYMSEDERAQWFAASDAVVCPYRHATGSGIAADALAFGRPVIGTRVDGLVDVVEDGVSGLLVPPGDAAVLADAMARFLREGLGARLSAGAVAARPRFSPEEHARRILALGGIAV
jgi:glycosyltransferase involved in cell wall biosynthesis